MSQYRQPPRFDGFKWLLVATCAILAILVVLLTRQNAALKRESSARPTIELKAGDVLGEIVVVGSAGQEQRLELRGPTLLLVFSSQCPACREILPFWSDLPAQPGPEGPEIIGLQIDLRETDTLAPYPVHAIAADRSPGMQRIPFVPATILVDRDGTVRRVWFGTPDDDQRREILRLIG